MRVKGTLALNPITTKLLDEGVIVMYEHKEKRKLTKSGEEEIAVSIRYKDKRPFTKGFNMKSTRYLKLFEGNPKSQMPFVLDAVLEKFINKDYIYLTHKDVVALLKERGVKPWSQPQFSKMINWFIDEGILFRSTEPGKYFYNTELIYNGSLARQLGFENVDPIEELMNEDCEYTSILPRVNYANISNTDDDLS